MIASAYLAAEALGEWVDGHLATECPKSAVAFGFAGGESVAHAIRKQPCYWASLFTAPKDGARLLSGGPGHHAQVACTNF
mgnify:CR=1 FL=1